MKQNMENMSVQMRTMICFMVAICSLALGTYFEIVNIRLGIATPYSWGFVKGLFDPILFFLFTFGGWICLIPLATALYLRLSLVVIFYLWLFVTLANAVLHSITSSHLIIFTLFIETFLYAMIFGPFLIFIIFLDICIKNMKKRKQN